MEGVDDATAFSAAHWPLPDGWSSAAYDDSGWPFATLYSNDTSGVNNKDAYTNFEAIFDHPAADAQFIWSSNVVLDNLVVLRTTIE